MDAQGNVRLRGRTKELINRGGIKFNPIDMEIAIAGHPAVAQVAIAPLARRGADGARRLLRDPEAVAPR